MMFVECQTHLNIFRAHRQESTLPVFRYGDEDIDPWYANQGRNRGYASRERAMDLPRIIVMINPDVFDAR